MADYDIIIIGSGAGGGTLALELAGTGKRILILERGDYLPREKENWEPSEIFLENRYQTRETWFDAEDEGFTPEAYYNVGGNTKLYGALLQRMRERDFDELHHAEGVSPAWPFDYAEMEPYYTEAERLFKIHGVRGEDPTEPPMSADYPFGPFRHEPRIQDIADALADKGLKPIHATLSLNRDEENPHLRPCIRCATCDPYPCLVDAKCDAQIACVDPALKYDNVILWTNSYVEKLVTSASGEEVKRVLVQRDGESVELSADTYVVSCGAVNSAALLLRSSNGAHPDGLANSSGQLGRNIMFHNHTGLVAVADKPNPTVFQKTLAFHDYYFSGPEQSYPLGTIQLTGKAPWQRLKAMAAGDLPQETLEHMAAHSVDWWVTTEDLPRPENRVSLSSDRIKVAFTPNNLKPHRELLQLWTQHLRDLGFYLFMTKTMPIETVWHQGGTAKFGTNPKESVLDTNCKAHDLSNLYVVDSSFMPSLGATNPTLTIIANALRVGRHLAHTL